MAHPYKPVIDFRSAASRTLSPEAFTILGGVALIAEAPEDPSDPATPMVVTVGGSERTRVLGSPAAGQYRVRVSNTPAGPEWIPELEFNAADEGLSGTCDYYRTGTIVTALRWESLIGFLKPITGVSDEATLNALYPASADPTHPGYPGRLAFTINGAGFVSDGSVWTQLAGMANWSAQQILAATLAAGQDAVWVEPGAALTGGADEAATLDVSADAAADVPGGLAAATTLGETQDGVWAAGGPTFPYTDSYATDRLASDYLITGGTWGVSAGRLHCTSAAAATDGFCFVNANSPANGYVEATIRWANGSGSYASLIARYVDANNYIKCYLHQGTKITEVYKYVGGVATLVGSWSPGGSYPLNTDVLVRFAYSGTVPTVTIDGTICISTGALPAAVSGKAGFSVYTTGTNADTMFDGLTVT